MRLDPNHDLSPQAIAALRDLVQEPPALEIGEPELIAFIQGAATAEERTTIIAALVASSGLRSRLAELHASHRPAETQISSRQLSKGIARALGVDGSLDGWDAAPDWSSLQDNQPTSEAVRSTLAAIGEGLEVLLKTPRFASLRGGATASAAGLPPGVDARSFAEIDDDGTLSFEAVFSVAPDSESRVDGRKIRLELLDPAGGSIPVGISIVKGHSTRLELPNFGTILGIEEGSLPDGIFRIVFEGEKADDAAPGFLIAATESDRVILTVIGPPTWTNGVLSLTLAVPKGAAERFAGGDLQLFAESEGVEIALASLPLSDFAETEKEIRIPIDGSGVDRQICGSLIRAKIVPPGRIVAS